MMFWEPHSSSIDFCESNYLLSDYIVEIHNTWSSILGLSSFGVLGLVCNNHTHEMRHVAAYSILVLIGIGSAGLHGTLHWFLQSSDELPMMYLLLSLIFLCAECDSSLQQCDSSQQEILPHIITKWNYPRLPKMLTLIAVMNTIIYFWFQKFYSVFLLTFMSETIIVIVSVYYVIYSTSKINKPVMRKATTTTTTTITRDNIEFELPASPAAAQRICNTGIISIMVSAVPCWLFDMLQCHRFVDVVNQHLWGMTPHVLWHFGAGYGAYCIILSLECCRLDKLQIPYMVSFQAGGLFPVVVTTRAEGSSNSSSNSTTSSKWRTTTIN